jgi:hypothetical protein
MTSYLFSAKGATFIIAWGNAPGNQRDRMASAESAIQLDADRCELGEPVALNRAFSAGMKSESLPWGDAPGCYEGALSALSKSVKIGVYPWRLSCF